MKLERDVGRLLKARGLTLAVAESCTGGLVCHRLTNVPGSSAYFSLGAVTYGNDAKGSVLGVREETLQMYGAVSEECAREMAEGVREVSGADVGLASTGIAGPGGGTAEKPVGLVYVALSVGERTEVMRYVFSGGRLEVKTKTSEAALSMLRSYLLAGFGDGEGNE